MASPAEELQRAIHALLTPLLAPVKLYDRVPEDAVKPYLSFGPEDMVPADAECADLLEITIQIDVWTDSVGRVTCKTLMETVRRALHDADLALATHALADSRMELARLVKDPDGLTHHGVLQFRFDVEAL